ncbi:hypothetical protein I350_05955 [Cryptococcus amylolentus CBS 6273]|uniref:Probable electron transfer flavoprotein subunit alpha n=1 Tax=Cryptococcus amylolentus CBS 6273 TaxID=1296118 RepID=A0A1E3JQG4_9TREE|nr:hypothetical protein I350_05955 [Cryptococcus amylolentus CBS 6273]
MLHRLTPLFPAARRLTTRIAPPTRRLASSLVLLEQKAGKLNEASLTAVTAAKSLGSETQAILFGSKSDLEKALEEAKKIDNVSTVYTASSDSFAHLLAEAVAPFIASVIKDKGVTHVFAAHTAAGKNVFPRLAGLLDSSLIADITALEASGSQFTRPIYAGNAILTIESSDKDAVKVITVRPTAFERASTESGSSTVEELNESSTATSSTRFLSEELTVSARPDLASASRVVSGGRALKSKDSFDQVLDPLADAFGAAVGASRAAVDAGYADNSLQVGQTGKASFPYYTPVVAPELYVAVGISGAIQHLAGMKESKMIVAINKDPDAPIFQVADAGLVADLFEAVPQLVEEVAKTQN